MTKQVDETLVQRGKHYGDFKDTFGVIQELKLVMQHGKGWDHMPLERREALEMIAVKLGRLVSGDSGHADSWHDIAGYARLVEGSLTKNDDAAALGSFPISDEMIRWLSGRLFEDAMNGGPLQDLCKQPNIQHIGV